MFTRLYNPKTDLPQLYSMAERALAEGRYSRYQFNADKFARLAQLAEVEPGAFCVVADDGGVLQGFLLGLVTDHHFVDVLYASDIAFYVLPEFRGHAAGAALVHGYEAEARVRGAQHILLGTTFGVEPARALQFYNSLGYETIGGLAIKYTGEESV